MTFFPAAIGDHKAVTNGRGKSNPALKPESAPSSGNDNYLTFRVSFILLLYIHSDSIYLTVNK
jgi:hypothetical protein